MADTPSVLFLGSKYWCRYLTDLYQDKAFLRCFGHSELARWIFSSNKVICLLGIGRPDTGKRLAYYFFAFLLRFIGVIQKPVIYWIGSDVLNLKSGSRIVNSCRNIAGSEWLAEEVRGLGYRCEAALFPVHLETRHALPFSVPDRLQVLCYVPDAHHELHGSDEIRIAVKKMPHVNFVVVGGVGSWWQDHPSNIVFTGWVDNVSEYLRESHVVLRRTAHDSLSAFVREGIVAGRYVIFSYDYPGTIYIPHGSIDELCHAIEDLRVRFQQRTLQVNEADETIRGTLVDTDAQLKQLAAHYG